MYQGGPVEPIEARFRYRVSGGDLNLCFALFRVEDIRLAAFTAVLTQLETDLGLPVLRAASPVSV